VVHSKQDVIDFCLTLPGTYEDYPFDEGITACMRHEGSRKIFAMVGTHNGFVSVNVKNEPSWGDFYRQTYPSIIPGYHCNKLHWSTLILDGSIPEDVIRHILTQSYDLTAPKIKKKYKDEF